MAKRLTLRDLKRAVEARGGALADEGGPRLAVYQAEAPDGFLWDGDLSAFRVEWSRGPDGRPTWPDEKQGAIEDALERIAGASLEPRPADHDGCETA